MPFFMFKLYVFLLLFSNDCDNYGAFSMLSKILFAFSFQQKIVFIHLSKKKKTKNVESEVHAACQNEGGQS